MCDRLQSISEAHENPTCAAVSVPKLPLTYLSPTRWINSTWDCSIGGSNKGLFLATTFSLLKPCFFISGLEPRLQYLNLKVDNLNWALAFNGVFYHSEWLNCIEQVVHQGYMWFSVRVPVSISLFLYLFYFLYTLVCRALDIIWNPRPLQGEIILDQITSFQHIYARGCEYWYFCEHFWCV